MPYLSYILSAKQHCHTLLFLIFASALFGCQSSPKPPYSSNMPESVRTQPGATLERLYQQYTDWRGTPYRLGGTNRAGIDCSAFVQTTFLQQFGIYLPRTTDQQIHAGKQIAKTELQAGDLVFFRKGDHVGIYLEQNKFLHASTRVGVTISSMENVYWSRKYWRSIRVQSRLQSR